MAAEQSPRLEWIRIPEARNFGLNWLKDGQVKEVHVDRHAICLVRKGDELYAVRARCPHSGGPMAGGRVDENGDLECPWHRFRFCPETGDNTSGEGYHLATYPIQLRPDGMYVGFEPRKPWWSIF